MQSAAALLQSFSSDLKIDGHESHIALDENIGVASGHC
jgi:hypothetical protein